MITFKKFFLFLAFVSISSNISAQSINNAFIESLPDSIRNDVLNQINTDNLKMLEAYDAIQQGVVYLKTDMLSLMSISVDYMDADGD